MPTAQCGTRNATTDGDASFLEDMVRPFDLQALNGERATRPGESFHSIIDLALASLGAEAAVGGW